jgi:lysyl-tRNA synthetase class 2
LETRGYLEVETPMLHSVASGAAAHPFTTRHEALDLQLELRIAPELHLKRLVVGGFAKVFEIGRVFRNEGISTRHSPEFTILEAYTAFTDYTDAMELVEALVTTAAERVIGSLEIPFGGRLVDLKRPWRRVTIVQLVSDAVGHEVGLNSSPSELRRVAAARGVAVRDEWDAGRLLVALYEHLVEPTLWDPTFVCDYPVESSPLARRHRDKAGFTERFECVIAGREIANAYTELCDPSEQRSRFEQQARAAAGGDEETVAVDDDYVSCLEFGLPPTAGLGIGVDRLVMLLCGQESIRDVVLFPTLRPKPTPG